MKKFEFVFAAYVNCKDVVIGYKNHKTAPKTVYKLEDVFDSMTYDILDLYLVDVKRMKKSDKNEN